MNRLVKHTCWLLFFTLVSAVGCNDPQTEIVKIFKRYGMNLIEPARSFIAIGGIFVVPKKGISHYIDPYETLPPTPKLSTDFKSVVQAQTSGQEIGMGVAMSGLAKLLPASVGFSFDHTKKVKLDQIDTEGSRYRSQDVDALILMPKTKQKLVELLNAKDGSKVYVIQEVYTAKSMSVSTSDGTSLSASYGGGGAIAKCSNLGKDSDNTDKKPDGSSDTKPADKGGAAKPASSADAAKKDSNQNKIIDAAGNLAKSVTGGSAGNTAGSTDANKTNTAPATKDTANGDAAGKDGITVSMCLASAGTLSFKSQDPLPFAVRLNQIKLSAGGTPMVMISGVSIPNQALPVGEAKTSAYVDEANPVVPEFDHITH